LGAKYKTARSPVQSWYTFFPAAIKLSKMRPTLAAFFFAAFPALSYQAASTIYTDRSCTRKPKDDKGSSFNAALKQAIDFAGIAADRLLDSNDGDAQNYFKYLFGRDEDKQKVISRAIRSSSPSRIENFV
jgi:hypothetical protein